MKKSGFGQAFCGNDEKHLDFPRHLLHMQGHFSLNGQDFLVSACSPQSFQSLSSISVCTSVLFQNLVPGF